MQSYDSWHVFGIQHGAIDTSAASSLHDPARSNSTKSSPQPVFKQHLTESESSSARAEIGRTYTPVIARVSTHVLRTEREYHLSKSFTQTSDPECNYSVRLIDLIRLPSYQGEPGNVMIVSIFESPGRNYLRDPIEFGPTCSLPVGVRRSGEDLQRNVSEPLERVDSDGQSLHGDISLSTFLEFAIGATECLELMHHGLRVVHGEIRGDAFYFNQETRAVKIINFGSGPRSFENGLTGTGWLTLSREVGIKSKLQFVAPEQTGRMPSGPDTRTDIYSLGILFWTMLTRQIAFDGETPMDVVQAVLGRRVPAASFHRMDVPDAVSEIIRKMTQKQIDERYHSTSGLKHDLVEVQKNLGDGDSEALANFKPGSKDVSSFFILPNDIFGREEEHERIVRVIEKVFKRQQKVLDSSGIFGMHSTSASSISDERFNVPGSSDTSSQGGKEPRASPALVATPSSHPGIRHLKFDSQDNLDSIVSPTKPPTNTADSRDSLEVRITPDHQSSGPKSNQSTGQQHGPAALPNRHGSANYRRKGKCEVIYIVGAAGLGKSRHVILFISRQSTQTVPC